MVMEDTKPRNLKIYFEEICFWRTGDILVGGTTMIEWSIEKATMIERSGMRFACNNKLICV